MESKNIKVIDEHGIDRVANIVCSIDVDGSDYVIYWIERDNDNDNLFVSKLIKNNDGTSNMMNIEDSLEKNSLNDIVKELITHAINEDSDKLSVDNVTLKNGKKITVSSVLFNKEQNINVQKTYITTVKKSVTKVSEDYYRVENIENSFELNNQQSVFFEPKNESAETIDTSINSNPEFVMPDNKVVEPVVSDEIANSIESLVQAVPSEEGKSINSEVNLDTSSVGVDSVSVIQEVPVSPVPQVVTPEPISSNEVGVNEGINVDARINIIGAASAVSSVTPEDVPANSSVVEPVQVTPVSPSVVSEPVTPVIPNIPGENPQPAVAASVVEPVQVAPAAPNVASEPVAPVVSNTPVESTQPVVTASVVEPVQVAPVAPNVASEPVAPVVQSIPVENPQPAVSSSINNNANQLFFDGSKESNLTEAFNDAASSQSALNVGTVEPIREFGQDAPVVSNVNIENQPPVLEEVKSTQSSGFVNNKFFMVIAITFFLASCVFLGYEVFRYFQMK